MTSALKLGVHQLLGGAAVQPGCPIKTGNPDRACGEHRNFDPVHQHQRLNLKWAASKQQGGELASADTTPRTKTTAVQITWLSPTFPRHPCRHIQRIHPSTSSAAPTAFRGASRRFIPHLGRGIRPPHDACCTLHSPRLNADNVTKPGQLIVRTRHRSGKSNAHLCVNYKGHAFWKQRAEAL